jgi:hypothetical protein
VSECEDSWNFSNILQRHMEEFRAYLQAKLVQLGLLGNRETLGEFCHALSCMVRGSAEVDLLSHHVPDDFYEHATGPNGRTILSCGSNAPPVPTTQRMASVKWCWPISMMLNSDLPERRS